MRRFGSDRIQGLMQKLGVEEDQPIESGMVTKALESAQTKVEAHNYETRKYVIEFDNVVNRQRSVIYQQRDRIIKAEDLVDMVGEMLEREVEHLISAHDISPPHGAGRSWKSWCSRIWRSTGGPRPRPAGRRFRRTACGRRARGVPRPARRRIGNARSTSCRQMPCSR